MKITSSFKDYYDGAGGFDSHCHYIRTEESKEVKVFKSCCIPSFYNKAAEVQEFVYVFFCGKKYIGIKINDRWSYNEKAQEAYAAILKPTKPLTGKWSKYFRPSFYSQHGNFFKDFGEDTLKVNIEFNSPVVIYHKSLWGKILSINGNLSKVGFGSAVDPFQASQSISTFLLNDLAKEIDIPVKISDKDRIRAHGFDVKTSFRDDLPPKRKRK